MFMTKQTNTINFNINPFLKGTHTVLTQKWSHIWAASKHRNSPPEIQGPWPNVHQMIASVWTCLAFQMLQLHLRHQSRVGCTDKWHPAAALLRNVFLKKRPTAILCWWLQLCDYGKMTDWNAFYQTEEKVFTLPEHNVSQMRAKVISIDYCK